VGELEVAPQFRERESERVERPAALLGGFEVSTGKSVPAKTAKGNGAVNQMGREAFAGFPTTRILTTSRALSNIFLQQRQNIEKIEENSFRAGRKLWKGVRIRALFLMVHRSVIISRV
jgi:hypothetical protein